MLLRIVLGVGALALALCVAAGLLLSQDSTVSTQVTPENLQLGLVERIDAFTATITR